jgi:P27 family predicted phage terminase small subunit
MAGTKGRSGRRKKPAEIKKRDRTFRADRDCDVVQFPSAAAPALPGPPIPDGLHPKARAEWKRLAPICAKLGLLTDGDWIAWEVGFAAYSTWLTASQLVSHPAKWTQMAESGYESIAATVTIAKQAAAGVMQFCREFGLTPSARGSLNIKPPEQATADPMEGMLN